MYNKNGNEKNFDDIFWADQLAKQIISREKFHYVDKKIKKFDDYTIKTSASLSGVLHIGRLSDTIRGESVAIALKDAGVKTRFIWVAENMDPLRKVPKGVPENFEKYIGVPVTDVPDVEKCHGSYAEHHTEEYFKVIDKFVVTKMEKFSMREEYKKGHFNPFIRKILEKIDEIKEIQNKYRTNPLKKSWSPWTPICENCGKIVTTHVLNFENGIVTYVCRDYEFETTTAKGCGFKGENNPLKGNGKLLWKSEWAAQWARWQVVSEGAGKEYQVPNSAWWINGEIVEKVLDFPMPVPIFYEHIMIDSQKMSASVGNVVYPRDWLEVAPAELLRLFYNKRLMTTRSFSWKDLPNLYDEYDKIAKVHSGSLKLENEKEESHYKRLFEVSHGKDIKKPIELSFSHAAVIAQIFPDEDDAVKSMEKTGHYDKNVHQLIFERLHKAKIWLKKYAPDEVKFELQKSVSKNIELAAKEKEALHAVAKLLKEREYNEKSLFEEFYSVSNRLGLKPQEFFKAAYKVLLNKERGPKLAPFIIALGKEKVIKLFEQI
ncbi:lysine--tRNA ligase [Candidatus Woesearchaeota archaeon]|nr:lysine--tRNA ligase [Candidatus Woesearchaeota archaeon]